jgi:hypothetical protein
MAVPSPPLADSLTVTESNWKVPAVRKEERSMSSEEYRYYHLDGDGRIHAAEWISAVNDEQAVEQVRANHPASKCEVWKGSRLIAKLVPTTFNPDDPALQHTVADGLSRLARQVRSGLEG